MNLLALRTEVLNRGFDPFQYGSRITQWLNDAQNLVCRRVDYYADTTSVAVTAVQGAPYFLLPDDFARGRELFDVDRNLQLEYVSVKDLDASSNTPGAPTYYAIASGAGIQLYPTPDGTYNLMLRYWRMPPPLVIDTDVPSLPDDWHHILWVYATWMAFEADDDAQMGQYWQQRFSTELSMFSADQKFPDAAPTWQAKGMWDRGAGLTGANQWSLMGTGW
jgi:hypothetical protein